MAILVGRGGAPDYCADTDRFGVRVNREEDPIAAHAAPPTVASVFQLDNVSRKWIERHRLNRSFDLHLIFSGKPCYGLLGGPCDGDCPGH